MSRNTSIAVLALTLVAAAPGVAQEDDAPVEEKPVDAIVVQVTGLKTDAGQIGCAVFAKEDGFPNETGKASKQMFIKPKGKKATCSFDALKPGTYAVSVVHDVDKNGELNTSFVGKPKEPWGVSNNAPAQRFGPPLYKDCKFKYEGAKKTLTVKLQD
jgi:uncharacterized protein (DUF2141 family)